MHGMKIKQKGLISVSVALAIALLITLPIQTFAVVKKPTVSKPVVQKKVVKKKVVQKSTPVAKTQKVEEFSAGSVCVHTNTYPDGLIVKMTTYSGDNNRQYSETASTYSKYNSSDISYGIKLDNVSYTWSGNEGMKQILPRTIDKATLDFLDYSESFDAAHKNKNAAPSPKIESSCTKWVIDPSKFVVPKNVNFQDLGEFKSLSPADLQELKTLMENSTKYH